ncbi:MAG: SDR family NAD(P)-dependent oxidoreductase [Pseudomonadales bacterium]|nr:SDR family NAD(P)-dependent oxidoreductase [Pseudomonadales bacterium]
MKDFTGKIAVVTGGGTGMGRELVGQLAAAGCHVAMCDVSAENMAESRDLALAGAPAGTRVTTQLCDVSVESQVVAFQQAVAAEFGPAVNLLFNNAGIGGGGSFVADDRASWEKTFGVCWFGVYYCSRAFMPMLIAADEAHLINTSSVNGFFASLGPHTSHTAYSAAKFAVKGFSEALITDLRLNAPHVKVSVVMPGHIGTSIVINSAKVLGGASGHEMSDEQVRAVRERWMNAGVAGAEELMNLSDDQIREMLHQQAIGFRDNAPTSAASAASMMLDAVRNEKWRVLLGEDAHALDQVVRANPEQAYDPDFWQKLQEDKILGFADR